MKDVVARIARLRALQARMAQADRVKAQTQLDDAVAVEQGWRDALTASNTASSIGGADAVGRGVFALNGEMRRRQAQGQVHQLAQTVEEHNQRVLHCEREQKVAERLVERRAARRRAERQRKEQSELDELARAGWFRRDG